MYYEATILINGNKETRKENLDTQQEIIEYMEKHNRPRFVQVKYFNCEGLVGVAKKMYSTLKENYTTYSKIKS